MTDKRETTKTLVFQEKLNSQLKVLTARKEMLFARIQKLHDYSTDLDNEVYLNNFVQKLECLQFTKKEFLETLENICDIELQLNPQTQINLQPAEALDDLICSIIAKSKDIRVQKLLGNISEPVLRQTQQTTCAPRLPKINLPTFSGNIKEWPAFYECFRSLIHENKELSDVDKINYLMGQLSGKTKSICGGLPPIGSNYKIIWDTLIEKYQNSRLLATSYLEQILEFKPLQTASANNLNNIVEKCDSAYRALQKLDLSDLLDFTFAYLVWSKLDMETRSIFENNRRKNSVFTYHEIMDFIKEQASIYAMSSLVSKPIVGNNKSKSHTFFTKNSNALEKCPICQSSQHNILHCSKFLSKSPRNRYDMIKNHNLCILCFGNHLIKSCKSSTTCRICNYKHNTLLHFYKASENQLPSDNSSTKMSRDLVDPHLEESNSVNDQGKLNTSTFCSVLQNNLEPICTVLLSTIKVDIFDKNGIKHEVRLLLDSGSQGNFLSVRCAKLLELDIYPCFGSVRGIGNGDNSIRGKSSVTFSSRLNSNISYTVDTLLVDKITDRLPDYKICGKYLEHLNNIPLADDTFHKPGVIDGILGAQIFSELIGTHKITGSVHAPIAIETKLGYVVMGSVPIVTQQKCLKSFCTTFDSLDRLVSKFWEIEDIPHQKFRNPDDLACEEIFSSTLGREASGRYVVTLPFKSPPDKLGNSYNNALKRFNSLENKLEKHPDFRKQYNAIFEEYLLEGYMSRLDNSTLGAPNYFIPHHGIFKHDSESTPLRIVFDASCKSSSGFSLNDLLYTGEKLQLDVFNLFLNFRLFAIAFTADISRMYLRIGLRSDHRIFQLILWRFSCEEPLQIFSLNTVSFGITSSPYLALRTLKQLANDGKDKFPLAAKLIDRDFFMDDYVSSVSSLEEAQEVYRQLVQLLASGNFKLTKWASNSEDFLTHIPESDRSKKIVNFCNDSLKVLGLQWFPKHDIFRFSINIEKRDCTKRNLLSIVARLFDPLGFIAPVSLLIKLLIKKLWSLKLEWDESPASDICRYWADILDDLSLFNSFEIPRHIGVFVNSKVSLIGFCDACTNSYGASVYVRSTSPNNDVCVHLMCSKTKVAPMKVQSIPRLELCAAHLLAKLLDVVRRELSSRITIVAEYAFSDSLVTLGWISQQPYKWQTFVANRVSQIQQLTPSCEWYHIKGEDNISDSLSRGIKPSRFLETFDSWNFGPDWLKLDVSCWPVTRISSESLDLPEVKRTSFVVVPAEPHPLYLLISRCSSLNKLLRTTVYVLRFLKLLTSVGTIDASDIAKAELSLVKIVQHHNFSEVFSLLMKGKLVSPNIRSLCPFLEDGIIRVGGRLGNSRLDFESKHPVLLPKNDPFANLLIDKIHRDNLHTGPSLVLTLLRHKYWIIGARNAVRFRLKKCNLCFRYNPRTFPPKMADLPSIRVTEAKPFLHAGVDMAGPVHITMSRKRGIRSQKAYICLFICLCTKALHLELVSDLSTDLFLAAFKRFLSRRGACSVIYSDCGTNFIGAKNELDKLHTLWNSSEFKAALGNEFAFRKICWKFQPPSSPHFSGVWESQVKSVKTHLFKSIGSQILSYEELNTVLNQIEALLNSRPLTWLSTDPSDPVPLTPAHFLTLTPLTSLPAPSLVSDLKCVLNRKRLLDQLVQTFWARWQNEYLTQLQKRQKWSSPSNTITNGTLVLIKQDNAPPLHWPVGVVESVFPNPKDHIVRVVNVRTKFGVYKRPVVKLCPLPLQ